MVLQNTSSETHFVPLFRCSVGVTKPVKRATGDQIMVCVDVTKHRQTMPLMEGCFVQQRSILNLHWSVKTLKSLTGEVNKIDHIGIM